KVSIFHGHAENVAQVSMTPEGDQFITRPFGKEILWGARTGAKVRILKDPAGYLANTALSGDRKRLLSCADNTAILRDVKTGATLRTFPEHKPGVSCVALNDDGSRALLGSWDTKTTLWDTSTEDKLQTFAGHTSWVTCAAINPDGRRVVTGSHD